MLDLDHEVEKLLFQIKKGYSPCCGGYRKLIKRFKRILYTIELAKKSKDYDLEQLKKIEDLIKELAKQSDINLKRLGR